MKLSIRRIVALASAALLIAALLAGCRGDNEPDYDPDDTTTEETTTGRPWHDPWDDWTDPDETAYDEYPDNDPYEPADAPPRPPTPPPPPPRPPAATTARPTTRPPATTTRPPATTTRPPTTTATTTRAPTTATTAAPTTTAATTTATTTTTTGTTTTTAAVPVTGISLTSASSVTLQAGNTHQIATRFTPTNATNRGLTFRSSDNRVATVSPTGLVTAHGAGSATITVTTTDPTAAQNFEASMSVTVSAAFTEANLQIRANPHLTTIRVGGPNANLEVWNTGVTPNVRIPNSQITWSSASSTIATVNANGVVTAVNPADHIVITATVRDGAQTRSVGTTLRVTL